MTHVEKHYSLKDAVTVFFPDSGLTVSSLRTEIRNGRLPHNRIAGKIVVTASDIGVMLKRCRENAKDQGSTSDATSASLSQHGSFAMDPERSAQDAAKQTITKLKVVSQVL